MTDLPTNLTDRQNDYAIFLPALSTFYALFIGRQRRGLEPYDENRKGSGAPYIDPNRIPPHLTNGVESLNWLDPQGLWQYKWSLHSAGHASLDLNKDMYREDQYRVRDRDNSWILGDSGGFQIGKGKWAGEWKDPNSQAVKDRMADCVARGTEIRTVTTKQKDPATGQMIDVEKQIEVDLVKEYQGMLDAAQNKREGVLRWMDAFMDYGMILDIPAWVSRSPEGAAASNITSYQEAVDGTKYNNEYFIKNRNGNCKFLNVLQGENFAQAEDWYQQVKHFCDPNVYPDNHFNGWAMGGQNMCDIHLALKRVVDLRFDGLLEQGKQDFMHFLGTSKLEWALVLTAIQRGVRKNHNPDFTITFDCASPFLCTANGQFYTGHRLDHNGKWSYMMGDAFDDKALASDTSSYDAYATQHCAQYGHTWMPTPLSEGLKVNDICVYNPGDKNRMGTETNTSWDSFAYALMMNHNVYTHVNSVQAANRAYDGGDYPEMLTDERFDRTEVKDVIARIFELDTREAAHKLIDDNERLWMQVVGTRGAVGKKTVNPSAQFNSLFEV